MAAGAVGLVAYLAQGYFVVRASAALSAVSLSDVPQGATRPPAGCWEENCIPPSGALDSRWWVVHTRELLEGGGWRVRKTIFDNIPSGREVHWSSGPVWMLAAMARAGEYLTGRSAPSLVAGCAMVAGPLLGGLCLAGLAVLVRRRWGWEAAAVCVCALLTSEPFTRSFAAGDFDHHGLVAMLAAGAAWCLAAGGAGWTGGGEFPTLAAARRWFTASGILGGAALWVSAATAIPVLAGLAIGGLAAGMFAVPGKGSGNPEPGLWRRWGVSGALASLGFYALEYFPGHMGMRLEVNHPLHALAWAGGGHVLASILEWRLRGWRWTAGGAFSALAGVGAVLLPLLVVGLASGKVFWVADSFLLEIHRKYIYEFQSLGTLLGAAWSWPGVLSFAVWPVVFSLSAAACLLSRQVRLAAKAGLALVLPAFVILCVMSWAQARWLSALLPMVGVGVTLLWIAAGGGGRLGWMVRGALALAAWISLLSGPLPEMLSERRRADAIARGEISGTDRGNLFVRDVAVRLLQASPKRAPVVLAGPNTSTELVYHAGIRVLGTLYWENLPGLRRAAEIYGAEDAERVLEMLGETGTTHVLLTSWDPFAFLLPEAAGGNGGDAARSYLARVFAGAVEPPDWLRPLAYPIPDGGRLDVDSVRLYAFVPGQRPAEALAYRGLFEEEAGRPEKALEYYRKAAAMEPGEAVSERGLRRLGGG